MDTDVLHRERSFKFLCLASAGVGFALILQIGVNANFSVEEMHLNGLQQGLLEAFRELCGISALGILVLLAGMAEPVIATWVLIIFGLGLASYAFVHHYYWLVIASMVWSQGLHVWFPLPNSMGLALAEKGKEGRRLGQIQGATACGSAAGLIAAYLLNVAGVAIRPLYILAGAVAIVAAVSCLFVPRQIRSERPKLVIRREYRFYYMLSFLEGWRKQIFLAFAGYLLVVKYGTSLKTILLICMVVQFVGWFSSKAVGRLIDRIGEKKVLVFYYSFMTICFLGYAFITNKYLLYAVYLVDNCFFVFAMALTTYIGRIAPASEKTLTLSTGVAANHIAAVTMPLLGGIIWKYIGYQWTFAIGSIAAAASIVVALMIPAIKRFEPSIAREIEPVRVEAATDQQ